MNERTKQQSAAHTFLKPTEFVHVIKTKIFRAHQPPCQCTLLCQNLDAKQSCKVIGVSLEFPWLQNG